MLSAISFGTWVALLCLVALIGLEIYFLITLNPILIVIGGGQFAGVARKE